jgi:hypothetical protein
MLLPLTGSARAIMMKGVVTVTNTRATLLGMPVWGSEQSSDTTVDMPMLICVRARRGQGDRK